MNFVSAIPRPSHIWLTLVRAGGALANLAGFPGFVREGEYVSEALSTNVTVRRTSFYTVITVNGVAVYFYRLTGGYDGVGATPASDCKSGAIPELGRPDA